MNIFSLITDPDNAVYLTLDKFYKKTHRHYPYIQKVNGETKAYALCPRCHNPVLLVNRINNQTESKTLYAKHVKHDVMGIASYSQQGYDDCSLANPTNLDAKIKRDINNKSNNEIKDAVKNYFDLLIYSIESHIGINFSNSVLAQMLEDFNACDGHQYRAINLYNLPLSFVYIANAQDLYGCRVNGKIKENIDKNSESFITSGTELYDKSLYYVNRKKGSPYNKILFYFSNHTISTENDDESVMLYIVEKKQDQTIDSAKILYKEKIYFDGTYFFNTMKKRARLNDLAKSIIQ
ncbi:hypothetical protein ACLO89_23510 [Escherichia coli]|uniref:hypothetical protein n=1 Tax=Escherichia coli TaxID=562 RepID=UPI003D263857